MAAEEGVHWEALSAALDDELSGTVKACQQSSREVTDAETGVKAAQGVVLTAQRRRDIDLARSRLRCAVNATPCAALTPISASETCLLLS